LTMNLAQPAGRVSPALADQAESVRRVEDDNEYRVEAAVESTEPLNVTPAEKVDPAVPLDDPRKFAPIKQLDEQFSEPSAISASAVEKSEGVAFTGIAAVSRGMKKTLARTLLPCCFDPREFFSYGELTKYIIIKDHNIFVFSQQSDSSPLYNVPVGSLKPVIEDPEKPHKSSVTISPGYNTNLQGEDYETVLLLDAMDALAYQFTFDISQDKDLPERFMLAVQNINVAAKSMEKVRIE